VLYPAPTTWPAVLLVTFNPVASYVLAARDLAAGTSLADPAGYAAWSIASLVLCLAGWRFFHLAMPRVIERL
jgi:ABC-type polysaccharide/polyol phosphate export permease